MLRELTYVFRLLLGIADALIVVPAFWLAHYLRTRLLATLPLFQKRLGPFQDYAWLAFYLMVVTPLILQFLGAYQPFRKERLPKIMGRLLLGVAISMALGATFVFFKQEWFYSRSLLLLWGAIYFCTIAMERIALVMFLRHIRRRGFNLHNIAIVGTGELAGKVISEIEAHRFWGMRIVGIIEEKSQERMERQKGIEVLGRVDEIEDILRNYIIDDVFFTLGSAHPSVKKVADACAAVGCSFYIVPEQGSGFYRWIGSEKLGSLPIISYRNVPQALGQLFIKRVIDLTVSCIAMVFFPLIYLIVGAAIKLDSPGPVIYASTRIGHNRRPFRCYKFRTMVKDADKLVHLLDEVNEVEGPIRKSSRDPRVTRVGRFLRKYSIDEIPQFINVLKGEMSLVGPRPPTPDEVKKYRFTDLRKLSMRQGITGLWQVSGRDAIKSFDERLRLDLAYIDNWSIWLDLKIILKTIFVIFKGGL